MSLQRNDWQVVGMLPQATRIGVLPQTMDMACYPKRCILACCPQDIIIWVCCPQDVYRRVAPCDVHVAPCNIMSEIYSVCCSCPQDVYGRVAYAMCVGEWPHTMYLGVHRIGPHTQLHHIGNKPIYILRS